MEQSKEQLSETQNLMFKEEWITSQKQIVLEEGLVQQWVRKNDNLNHIKDFITCNICNKIMWNPKVCENCDGQYCQPCIQKYLTQENKQGCSDSCEEYVPRKFTKMINQKLQTLHFICPFKSRGCFREDLKYSEFEKHINLCQYRQSPSTTKYQSITIKEHLTKPGDLYGEFISYIIDVVIDKKHFSVSRRFKQFERMHSNLEIAFKGHAITPLPPKSFKMNQLTDLEFIQERQYKLQTYLQLISENPVFENNEDLYDFLTQDEYDIEIVQQYIEGVQKGIEKVSSKISYGAKFLKNWWGQSQSQQEEEQQQPQQAQQQEKEDDHFDRMKYTSLIQQYQDTRELFNKEKEDQNEQIILNNIQHIIKYSDIFEKQLELIEIDKVYIHNILRMNLERSQKKPIKIKEYNEDEQNIENLSSGELQNQNQEEEEEENKEEQKLDINLNSAIDKIPSFEYLDDLINTQIDYNQDKEKFISTFYTQLYKLFLRTKSIHNCMNSIMKIKQEIESIKNQLKNEIEMDTIEDLEDKLESKNNELSNIMKNSQQDSDKIIKRIKQESSYVQESFKEYIKEYYIKQPKTGFDSI